MRTRKEDNRIFNGDQKRLEFEAKDLMPTIQRKLAEGVLSIWDINYTDIKIMWRKEFMFWIETRGFYVVLNYQDKQRLLVFNKMVRNA